MTTHPEAARAAVGGCQTEIWRDVVDFEGVYAISSRGRVMSLPRTVPIPGQSPRRLQGRILKPSIRPSDGREHVALCRNAIPVTRNIDRLMREAGFK